MSGSRRDEASHVQYEELVVGHALSALEPEDEQDLLRHLSTCAACERDLAVHRETLGHLAHAVESSTPPPQLWDAIHAQVVAESGAEAFPGPDATVVPVDRSPTAAAAPTAPAAPTQVDELAAARDRRARRRRRAGAWASLAAAAALVTTVGLGVTRQRDQQQGVSDRFQSLLASVEQGPGQTVPLTGRDGKPVAVALVQAGKVSLLIDGLAPNDTRDSTYVLWAQSGAEKTLALGSFDVDGPTDVKKDMYVMSPDEDVPQLFVITQESGRTAPDVAHGAALATGRAA